VSCWRLTSDGAFTIAGEGDALQGWLPAGAVEAPVGPMHLDLAPAPLALGPIDAAPTLSLLEVGCWIEGDEATLRDPAGTLDGRLKLDAGRGTIGATRGAHIEPILTIATALLLGRRARALVHAAAVVAPSGGVWLLVGDTHAGKSTTVATLLQGGWGWLADDQVVLRDAGGRLVVEGWARQPNLDEGYRRGEITGRRVGVERSAFGVAPLAGEHPLAGILLPRVDAASATALAPASSADTFAALVRQSPWLLADPAAAAALHALLVGAAGHRAARLALGRDSYGRGAVLAGLLRSLGE